MQRSNVMRAVSALLLVLLSAASAAAQTRVSDPTRGHFTRAELHDMLASYEQMALSSEYSGTLREQARREAELVRQRLDNGDLREGDRILLVVEGHEELTDTFNVLAGRRIVLPYLGDVQLAGVLRAELQQHLTTFIARFIREPTVHARSLMRVEIRGAVTRPGFYTVPSDYLVSDALMMAGGPSGSAGLGRLRIERGAEILWDGDRLREAVVSGQTLDQLNARTGDAIFVPGGRNRMSTARDGMMIVTGVVGLLIAVFR